MPEAKPVAKTIVKSVTSESVVKENVPKQEAPVKEPSLIDLINHQKKTGSVLDGVTVSDKRKPVTPVNLIKND